MKPPTAESSISPATGFVDADALRQILWPDPDCRPSLRWIRTLQARRAIPFLKLGAKVFFEPERVRGALRRFEQTVEA
jgi:hypothetical protein